MWFEFYIVFTLLSILTFLVLRSIRKRNLETSRKCMLNELTVVIPFRNESENLEKLLDSLENQSSYPKRLFFVDDHSEDTGAELIRDWCKRYDFARLLKLNEQAGKKMAIHRGVVEADTEYVLTLDADVWFDERFFESFEVDAGIDMVSRPVVLKGGGIERVSALEQQLLNSFNYLLYPIYPLTSSGANLLFRKDAYLEYNQLENHKHIASGDDHFLLRNFHKEHLQINMSNKRNQLVYSQSPTTIKMYLSQRIRWFGKTLEKTNIKEFLIGLYLSFYLIGGLILITTLLITQNYYELSILIIVRFCLDVFVLLFYSFRLNQISNVWLIPVNIILQPLLMILVMTGSVFYKPKWKGRTT